MIILEKSPFRTENFKKLRTNFQNTEINTHNLAHMIKKPRIWPQYLSADIIKYNRSYQNLCIFQKSNYLPCEKGTKLCIYTIFEEEEEESEYPDIEEGVTIQEIKIQPKYKKSQDLFNYGYEIYDEDSLKENHFNDDSTLSYSEEEPLKDSKENIQGHCFKLCQNKLELVKYFIELKNGFFYIYKNNRLRSFIWLRGTFFKQEPIFKYKKETFYCFSITYTNNVKKLYFNNINEYTNWLYALKNICHIDRTQNYKIIKETNLNEYTASIEARCTLQNEKVEITRYYKSHTPSNLLKDIKREIKLKNFFFHDMINHYDTFENHDYLYIINKSVKISNLMEYFSYSEFTFPEKKIKIIIKKIAEFMNYLFSYGIIINLNPENFLLNNVFNTPDTHENGIDLKINSLLDFQFIKKKSMSFSHVYESVNLFKLALPGSRNFYK
jgi:hypothetical protein